ncbi:MAG: SURF1 family protein, partial [Proteobacteria bacterium]|nr:SURF1 family protein [Pseudomonadota bacterium]
MKHKKSLLLAGVFTVLGLGILMWMGFWQLERLEWKTALLAKIETNMAMTPISLAGLAGFEENEFRRVCASGEFLHEQELYLFSSNLTGTGGYHIYTPLIIADGKALLVNPGWVPNSREDSATR